MFYYVSLYYNYIYIYMCVCVCVCVCVYLVCGAYQTRINNVAFLEIGTARHISNRNGQGALPCMNLYRFFVESSLYMYIPRLRRISDAHLRYCFPGNRYDTAHVTSGRPGSVAAVAFLCWELDWHQVLR